MSRPRVRRCKSRGDRLRAKWAAERQKGAKVVTAGEVIAQLGDHMLGRYKQGELGAKGAGPSNTAPHEFGTKVSMPIAPSVTIIYQGIDTITFNLYGSLRESVIECLRMAKENAQAAEGDWAESPLPPFDGVTPRMHASGVRYYDYHLSSDDLDIKLREPSKNPIPAGVIRVSAQALARMGEGGETAARLAEHYLRELFEDDGYRVQLGIAHLATDWQGWQPEIADLENVVRRAGDTIEMDDEVVDLDEQRFFDDPLGHLRVRRSRARVLSGLSSGVSTNIRLNLYHKTRQVVQEGKAWVQELWDGCPGYNPRLQTWRVEYQFGREFLHKREIETLHEFLANRAALWAYGMVWYSFRIPSETDRNRSRWHVAPAWLELSNWGGHGGDGLPKVKVVRPKMARIAASLHGYVTSMAAITGVDNLIDAAAWAFEIVQEAKGLDRMGRMLDEKRLRYHGFTMAGV